MPFIWRVFLIIEAIIFGTFIWQMITIPANLVFIIAGILLLVWANKRRSKGKIGV